MALPGQQVISIANPLGIAMKATNLVTGMVRAVQHTQANVEVIDVLSSSQGLLCRRRAKPATRHLCTFRCASPPLESRQLLAASCSLVFLFLCVVDRLPVCVCVCDVCVCG